MSLQIHLARIELNEVKYDRGLICSSTNIYKSGVHGALTRQSHHPPRKHYPPIIMLNKRRLSKSLCVCKCYANLFKRNNAKEIEELYK
jgi:hypothetical protein